MSYTTLYRKYRPVTFDDVTEQEHIVTTLKNQIKNNRIGHAYLFCGTRGTGKTTIAKIMARAVNCEHPVDGNPCGECEICKAMQEGKSMNVIEIDAASNNGVDNVRDIIEQISYAPTEGKYKVFIIDEVHMLSTAAFNALLKTLEEPPAYVIFILATTEVHKIPVTVLSRCQEYDFHRITVDGLSSRMKELLDREGGLVTDEAIRYIAKAADGAMRDALSLLDQCMAFFMDTEITLDNVLEVLGAVDQEVYQDLLKKIEEKDATAVLEIIDRTVMEGRDLQQFVADFIWYMRNLLLIKTSTHVEDIIDMSKEAIEDIRQQTENISSQKLIRYIRILSELSASIRYSGQRRIEIEVAFIKMCRPQSEQNMEALIDRINQLENVLYAGGIDQYATMNIKEPIEKVLESANAPALGKRELPKAIPEDIKETVKNFRSIVSEVSSGIDRSYLETARLNLNGDRLQIVFSDEIGYDWFADNDEERKKSLANLISERMEKEVPVEIAYNNTGKKYEDAFVDLEKVIKMGITVEEE